MPSLGSQLQGLSLTAVQMLAGLQTSQHLAGKDPLRADMIVVRIQFLTAVDLRPFSVSLMQAFPM